MLRVPGIHIDSARFVSGSARKALVNRVRVHLDSIAAMLSLWTERTEQRQRLHQLDAHLLRDIGIDRREMLQETSKPFWRD